MSDLMKMADELGQAIKTSNEFINYEGAKKAHDADSELQDKINTFESVKQAIMEEMQKENRDEKKIEVFQASMREAYSEVMKNTTMTEYLQAKEDLESLVNDIYGVINYHVTGKQPGSCGGNCSSCGGCA